MKKLQLLLLALLFHLLVFSQAGQNNQVNIITFNVKNTLPARIDSWISTPGALILVAQKAPGARIKETLLVLQIRSGSAMICGTTVTIARPIDPFDVRTFNTADLVGMLAGCNELKEGIYTICAQFFNLEKIAISREVCKDFRVEAANVEYAPPTLITPEDEKNFSITQMQGPVLFRWTPLVPKPRDPVTYRLKVWQLMEGQNATTAMRTNQPIVTKDVDNLTQATVSGIYTGPCRPPYLCDFIWNVQALTKDGKPLGNNNGNSEPYRFGIQEVNLKAPVNVLPENNAQYNPKEVGLDKSINFRWTPVVPKPQEPVTYRLKVWQLMQGQNASTAMRTNKPIVTKDVADITEAPVSGIYTGPCKPPYLCDFVWNVQALDRAGKPVGDNEGTSDAWGFKITEDNAKCPTNTFPEDKKKLNSEEAIKEMMFRWTPVVPKPQSTVTYRLKVWQLMQGQTGAQAMRTNQPIVTKDVDNISEATVSGIYTGPCRPPYLCVFMWAVETRNAAGQISCTSEPTTFSVTEENAKCPTNTFPEDKKKLNSEEAIKEMMFRWTPVVPKPQSAVTYRLKVWQLMQGQTGAQAMRTNKPIVTKDVDNITEAALSGIYTGPCRPPYLCDFIWAVETRNAAGQISCTSEPTTFSVTEDNAKCPTNTFPEDKKKLNSEEAIKEMMFRWTPVVPKPQSAVTYRLKVWQLMQGQNASTAMGTNKPIVTKDVADITEATVSSIYTGPCRPPYLCVFVWAVETRNAAGQISCTSEPTTFSVTEENAKCPTNTFPEDKKKLNSEEAIKEMMFRWTPVVPKPQSAVTYRFKVWQLMQGQTGAQAMRTNKPIVTKDVDNITEAALSGIYTGPCRPPYLCDFIWAVEMMDATGRVSCISKGTGFSVKE